MKGKQVNKTHSKSKVVSRKKCIAGAIIALAAGIIITCLSVFFIFVNGLSNSAIITEKQLDERVATYVYDWQVHSVSSRDVFDLLGTKDKNMITQDTSNDENSSEDSSQQQSEPKRDSDGNILYYAPSSDDITTFVQNETLVQEAKKRGLTVNEADKTVEALLYWNSDDRAKLAEDNDMSQDELDEMLTNGALISKLQFQILSEDSDSNSDEAVPAAPQAPASGSEDEATEDYANYIKEVAKEDWDSATNTWSKNSSAYSSVLSDNYAFDGQKATYTQALIAYSVAMHDWSTEDYNRSKPWSDFQDNLFSKIKLVVTQLPLS